jgi:hypothetical protein
MMTGTTNSNKIREGYVMFYPFDSQSCRIIFIFLNGDGIRIGSVTVNTEISKVRDDWIIESTGDIFLIAWQLLQQ